jgi:hypothetical protein
VESRRARSPPGAALARPLPFTLQVYQQTRNRRLTDRERQAIWELMRFADEPTECPFTRQVTRTDDPEFRPVNGPMGNLSPSTELDELTDDE